METTSGKPERVIAYIDGFNVYQGLIAKGRRDLLWLDYRALIDSMLRPDQILVTVYYFTAHRTSPPESYSRQQIYFNALDARGGIERVTGRVERRKIPCVHCGRMTEDFKERATDTSLASQMVADAAHGRLDTAFLVSGDSDFVRPVEHTQSLGVKVRLLRPPSRRSKPLANLADYLSDLQLRDFRRCLLPDPVPTGRGTSVDCPFSWLLLAGKIDRLTEGHRQQAEAAVDALPDGAERHLHSFVDQLWASEQAL